MNARRVKKSMLVALFLIWLTTIVISLISGLICQFEKEARCNSIIPFILAGALFIAGFLGAIVFFAVDLIWHDC